MVQGKGAEYSMLLTQPETEKLARLIEGNHQLPGFCRQLRGSASQNLPILEQTFDLLSAMVQQVADLAQITCPVTATAASRHCSHVKQRLLEHSVVAGRLVFELMCFTGASWTEPHIHPEYVIDEIIAGSLEEHMYQLQQDNAYHGVQQHVRSCGDRRVLHDPEGCPHRIRSADGCAVVLTLYLGTRPVQPIQIIGTDDVGTDRWKSNGKNSQKNN